MKQKNLFIYFGFAFLLGAGLMLLLSTRSNVAAEANSKPATAVADDISTAFTYQGTLDDDGSPANGQYDFDFSLWDAPSGGSQLQFIFFPIINVTVTNGHFTVNLPFGSEVYASGAVWLEIRVREAGETAYETLTPRQPLTAAPLALSLPNVYTNSATDHVSIGTVNPVTSETFTVKAPTIDSFGGMYVATSGNEGKPFYGYSANGTDKNAFHYYDGETSQWGLWVEGAERMIVQDGETAIVGDVTQGLDDDGLVKAAVVAECSSSGSSFSRSFNNVNDSPITIANGSSTGHCTISFGFNINQRYWSTISLEKDIANSPQPNLVTCVASSPTSLKCRTFDSSGNGVNGQIMVIIH